MVIIEKNFFKVNGLKGNVGTFDIWMTKFKDYMNEFSQVTIKKSERVSILISIYSQQKKSV